MPGGGFPVFRQAQDLHVRHPEPVEGQRGVQGCTPSGSPRATPVPDALLRSKWATVRAEESIMLTMLALACFGALAMSLLAAAGALGGWALCSRVDLRPRLPVDWRLEPAWRLPCRCSRPSSWIRHPRWLRR